MKLMFVLFFVFFFGNSRHLKKRILTKFKHTWYHSTEKIKNDSFYISNLTLHKGSRVKTIEEESAVFYEYDSSLVFRKSLKKSSRKKI